LENTCSELLDLCLRGEQWSPSLLNHALQVEEGRAFLSVVVERLGDLFDPQLCDVYDRLFRAAVERIAPELQSRIRPVGPGSRCSIETNRVYVLSRVTLGADVAVTSVLLDAAKRRYPEAEIFFVGPRKNYELFEADPRIAYQPAPYARSGALRERLAASAALWIDDGIVLDSDSRLSQLGVLSLCKEDHYFWFESRAYGGDSHGRLPDLASQWAKEILGVEGARPYIAPLPSSEPPVDITVSLGVGENPAKRIDDNFESELLAVLGTTGASILVDKGASEEERRRVERALQPGMRTHDGAFAPFAAQIARSKLFVGYDSAAGHVASACGSPLISIASGFANARGAARWRPNGTVLTGDTQNILRGVKQVLASLRVVSQPRH
jgi:hypothetical protein